MVLVFLLLIPAVVTTAEPVWTELEPGLEAANFASRSAEPDSTGDLTVLRLDPERWDLRFYSVKTVPDGLPRTPDRWREDFGLVAVLNAGMYQEDFRTHVGYCQVDGTVLNRAANDYLSAVALDPVTAGEPPLRIFDLDETPLQVVAALYRTVLQNLRLIKRPRQNRWQSASARWPEAALAEDDRGRALLIHCRTPLSMHDFNELILQLPLGVVCAQHLEGNQAAQLSVAHPRWRSAGQPKQPARALPFVLGVLPRTESADPGE